MTLRTRGRRLVELLSTAMVAVLMLGAFAMVGGFGDLQVGTAEAAAATSIQSISVSSTCGSAGGFTGTVTLDGTLTGTVQLGLFYHVPGGSQFVDSGLRANASFTGGNTATYNFATFSFPGANSYRIQVINGSGLSGTTIKSNSVPLCTGTTTTTSTTTSSTTSTTSSTTTVTTTTGTTTTATTT